MNEHKNTISQSNHSALVISFRIKKSATQEIFIICLFVCLFVFVGFCFCFGICFVVVFFSVCLLVCLFASWSLRTDMRSSISMVTEPFSRVKSYSFVTPLTSI